MGSIAPSLNIINSELNGKPRFFLTFLSPEIVSKFGLPNFAIVGETKNIRNDGLRDGNYTLNPTFNETLFNFFAYEDVFDEEDKENLTQGEGDWLYVIDNKSRRPEDATPPEDIIGAYNLSSGDPKDFQANKNYRAISKNGSLNLGKKLNSTFLEYLNKKIILAKT